MSVYDDTTHSRPHDEIGTGAPPPPEITERFRDPERRLALTVACTFCGTRAGEACHFRGSNRPLNAGYHHSRLKRAQVEQPQATSSYGTAAGTVPSDIAAGTLR